MEWIFLIVLVGVGSYVGIEVMRHFVPSYSDKMWEADHAIRSSNRQMIEEIHAVIVGKKDGGAND